MLENPQVIDISPWHPAVQAGNYEAAIRELQGNVQALFREVDRHGQQIAELQNQIVRIRQNAKTGS